MKSRKADGLIRDEKQESRKAGKQKAEKQKAEKQESRKAESKRRGVTMYYNSKRKPAEHSRASSSSSYACTTRSQFSLSPSHLLLPHTGKASSSSYSSSSSSSSFSSSSSSPLVNPFIDHPNVCRLNRNRSSFPHYIFF